MKLIKTLLVSLVILAFAAAAFAAGETKTQTVCPVLAGNVDKKVYVDYQGKRIYFCCKGCDAEFKKDPEKFLKKMQEEGVTPKPSPAEAPKK